MKLFKKESENNVPQLNNISSLDLQYGFQFTQWLLSKGYNPLSILCDKDLAKKYVDEFEKERVG